jgi:hypothetical protein
VAASFTVSPAVSSGSQAAAAAAVTAPTSTFSSTTSGSNSTTTNQSTVAAIAVAQTPATKTATDQVLAQNTNWLSTALFA